MPSSDSVIITDGSSDFSSGVDSVSVPTIQSQITPNGLMRSQLAWLSNGRVRDGGITQRASWNPVVTAHDGSALYQGGYMYEPEGEFPYLILLIGGFVWKVPCDGTSPTNLSAIFGESMPPTEPQAFFVQAEMFLVIQAGDFTTLPLFWDNVTLRRSIGITNPAVGPGTPGVNEIPAAGPMDYHMGRIWYAQGRQYSAGDIVGGNSGTPAYNLRDSVLNVTENPLVLGGDGFTVPSGSGNIRALKHSANLDTALGQGQLYIFTRKQVFALNVPVTRTAWIAADNNNQPLQTVIQLVNGGVNDRSVVAVNGDLFFQSLEPSIRSLVTAVRYFQQWGNVPISANENRILQFNDRSLLRFSSGISFDNRLLQTALPRQTSAGVVHSALIPMDFMPISGFGRQSNPIWEGMYEGLDFFQMFTGDFGGLERAFGVVLSRADGSIQLWELSTAEKFENGDNRVTWSIEWPAFTWGKEFLLKKLVSAEIWIDRLFGEVDFTMEYRPDSDPCRYPWVQWKMCSARNSCEDVQNPVCYPLTPYKESFRATATLPLPPEACERISARPANVGYQFQPLLTVHGFCRIRGILLHAEIVQRQLYEGLVC